MENLRIVPEDKEDDGYHWVLIDQDETPRLLFWDSKIKDWSDRDLTKKKIIYIRPFKSQEPMGRTPTWGGQT